LFFADCPGGQLVAKGDDLALLNWKWGSHAPLAREQVVVVIGLAGKLFREGLYKREAAASITVRTWL
jgi:hypothetical protein